MAWCRGDKLNQVALLGGATEARAFEVFSYAGPHGEASTSSPSPMEQACKVNPFNVAILPFQPNRCGYLQTQHALNSNGPSSMIPRKLLGRL